MALTSSSTSLIDAAAFLTTVNSVSGNVITVADAKYFYDGWGIPGETGDIIYDDDGNSARIQSINYDINQITLDSASGFTSGDKVTTVDYSGSAPDIGAYEYTGTTTNPYCGDGTCNNGETCSTCQQDCGSCQQTNPVANYKFDDGTGTTATDSQGSNDGTLVNGPVWTSDSVSGSALSFDGVDDYVSLGNPSALKPQQLTVSAWAKLDSTFSDGYVKIIDGDNDNYGYQLYDYNSSSGFTFGVGHGSYVTNVMSGVEITDQWVFVVGTYDGATAKVYVNGVLNGSSSASAIDYSGVSRIEIGNRGSDARHWKGEIDEVKVFNRALSASEIQDLYSEFSSQCSSGADTSGDSVVSINELLSFISKWKDGGILIGDLLSGISEWKSGC